MSAPQYPHERAAAAVAALTSDATNQQIAETLATYLLVAKTPPITLSINHNAKAAPCPLLIDRPGAKSSSVTLRNVAQARAWVIDALLRGYEVTCGTRRGQESRSIASEQRAIAYRKEMDAWRAKRAAAGPDIDDEIPF